MVENMEGPLKLISRIVGGTQCVLGGILAVLAYFVSANPATQTTLAIAQNEAPLYTFLFLVFGIFLILSGLMLLSKENGGKGDRRWRINV